MNLLRPCQFSLRSLFSAVLLAALVLAAWRIDGMLAAVVCLPIEVFLAMAGIEVAARLIPRWLEK